MQNSEKAQLLQLLNDKDKALDSMRKTVYDLEQALHFTELTVTQNKHNALMGRHELFNVYETMLEERNRLKIDGVNAIPLDNLFHLITEFGEILKKGRLTQATTKRV